uniref:Deoxyribonuclease TATDN1 n=1 Tax=Scylla olivacea TaxID=85551 RepID=A0A0P4VWF2_SCYOL
MAKSITKEGDALDGLEGDMGALLTSENYIIVDIGANLTNKKFTRDLDSVVGRARDAGVHKIMVTGTTVQSSKEALRLTRLFPETLYSTAATIVEVEGRMKKLMEEEGVIEGGAVR